MSDLGFLTMAFGPDKYFRQAETMALSLRRHMPGIPIAVVTDRENAVSIFDISVRMKPFSQAGTIHKVELYDYSPFSETLFIDSDSIVTRPFHRELSEIGKYDFTPVVPRHLFRGDTDFWLADVTKALDQVDGESFPKYNGGIYFFRKVELARRIFLLAKELRADAEALGIKDFDSAGPGDETLIGLALAALKVSDLYDDHGDLMRTPLNIIGKLRIDALGGGCSFNKEGVPVSPAICHFCGQWGQSPEYLMAEFAVRNGRRPSPLFQAAVFGDFHARRYWRKAKRRIMRNLSRFGVSVSKEQERFDIK